MKRLLSLLIVACLLIAYIPCIASASEITVTDATEFANAVTSIENGGTIKVSGTVNLSSWPSANKTVTVTGGTLDFSNLSSLTLGCGVDFENITLTFKSGATLYANGNHLSIAQSVTVNNAITVYGGGNGNTVSSTDVTILSGTYATIFGGSKGGTVTGNTNLTVGGSVNSGITESDHGGSNNVYGGSNSGDITGSANLTFIDGAKAHYIYGGNKGSGTIRSTNVTMSGGAAMSIYGGSAGTAQASTVNLTMTGGTVEQVFGANVGSGLTGNIHVNLLGGTITRRVYGGCYNEATRSGLSVNWESSHYVTGNIYLGISGGVNITFSYSESDKSIYAHSRQKTLSSTENSQIIFLDNAGYSTYKNKLKAQDIAMMYIMGSTSAADAIHYYTYTASGSVITQGCICGCSATVTLNATGGTYTGGEIKTANVTVSDGWFGDAPAITYTNNINAGTATASITVAGATASVNFNIDKATHSKPSVSAVGETIKGKADGKISGLTTAMEISTNGASYSVVTDVNASFAPGKYYVRNAADANHNASEATEVTVKEGRMLTVTFKAEGSADIVKEVAWNGTLTDIPTVPSKTGMDPAKSKWSVTDFKNIQQDMVVNAIYSAKTYTVTFDIDGEKTKVTVEHGKNVDLPEIPEKTGYTSAWDKSGKNITADTTITAKYTIKQYKVTYMDGDRVLAYDVVDHGSNSKQPTVPTKDGHTSKWDHDGKNITQDTVINVVYTLKTYKVTYIADGKTVNTQDVKYNQNATAPAVPQKNGYTAVWDKDGKNITADTTITAIYVSVNAGKYIDESPKDNYGSGALTQSAEQLRLTVPMTKSEQAAIDNGEDVTLRFTVADAASTVTDANKKAVASAVKDGNAGAYLDLSMTKQVGNAAESAVKTLNSEVTVTVAMPQSLINTDSTVDRAYKLVHVENGKATVVSHIFEDGIISFNTTSFGTYAIVIVDTKIVEVAPPVIEVPTTPVEDPTEATGATEGTQATTPDASQETVPSTSGTTGSTTGNADGATGSTNDSSVPSTTQPTQNEEPKSSFPGIVIALAVILVLAGGGCGFWFWYQKKKKA